MPLSLVDSILVGVLICDLQCDPNMDCHKDLHGTPLCECGYSMVELPLEPNMHWSGACCQLNAHSTLPFHTIVSDLLGVRGYPWSSAYWPRHLAGNVTCCACPCPSSMLPHVHGSAYVWYILHDCDQCLLNKSGKDRHVCSSCPEKQQSLARMDATTQPQAEDVTTGHFLQLPYAKSCVRLCT
eukprot:464199-Amphidinium_carterae.2